MPRPQKYKPLRFKVSKFTDESSVKDMARYASFDGPGYEWNVESNEVTIFLRVGSLPTWEWRVLARAKSFGWVLLSL